MVACALGLTGCSSTGSSLATTAGETTASAGESAVVDYVNDGDTLRTTSGEKVRLLQIDAPELHGDCYGKAALVALRLLAPKGTHIALARDPGLDQTDAYGRLLRYVIVNGTNVNVALVREGAASPYFFHNEKGRYAHRLLAAADRARTERLGYWGACPGAKLNPGIGSITGPA